jgi:hypothetical protein
LCGRLTQIAASRKQALSLRTRKQRKRGARMTIPTEPSGSIPRPPELIEAVVTRGGSDPALDPLYDEAVRDTIARFEETGSPADRPRPRRGGEH